MIPTSFHRFPSLRSLAAVTLATGLGLGLAGCGKQPEPPKAKAAAGPALDTVEQRVSYGLGLNMGGSLTKEPGFTVDHEALKAGLDDGLAGTKSRIAEADIMQAFTTLRQQMAAANAASAEKQLAAGKAYLAQNRVRPGVMVTASGLQYEILTKGSGAKPKTSDTVVVHYHGTLTDGTVFDSSVQRGQPATFGLTGVIPGWTEALQLMSVGDKWKLTIPPELAYGAHANGKIPANSVLIFEVQLLGIK